MSRGRLISHARHRVGVHILAVSEGEVEVGALDLETELLVERDAGGVSKDENERAQLPRPADGRRRRALEEMGKELRGGAS
jgi:hypothetical protein